MSAVYFWKTSERPHGIFSQWAPSPFTEDGITFPTAEHYMMYHKAVLFNDQVIAEQILQETRPVKVKALGQRVRNFVQSEWAAHRYRIVFNGNMLKFGQNPGMKEILLSTKSKEIVEASPYDRIWGIGYTARAAAGADRRSWGLNLLGKALMDVREALK
ncbi:uncharacterized protein SPPG_05975 [Spizellomyces punctatus DAOM BR117]|uniref:NADAR domain-containing protein n=1 Tax=Spizellomyces punctatus (strain DAOM BR117) TaxID=645134 RepID=A0A0L0HDE9_SPIPD|nr:uncharacterized protein SPPG_05975 [Spizellomyces punctatus DAOM BR117]KNC99026.1 hypothetical protein SPPG_05975 [Spizellomyces punctatus DAOM BR117]|eukprot:XP_016607066.1 hypothetical protein SPPG_05975 [Spizellomyces punctatus DAOM BR117]